MLYCVALGALLYPPPLAQGDVAEWLRSGLQIRVYRFDSGRRLQRVRLIRTAVRGRLDIGSLQRDESAV